MEKVLTYRYSLFLDDLRDPPSHTTDNWIVARSYDEAMATIELHGMPTYISFDYGLGDCVPTGHDFAKKLVEMSLDGVIKFPDDFAFGVHSVNPVGAENVRSLMNNFLKNLKNG